LWSLNHFEVTENLLMKFNDNGESHDPLGRLGPVQKYPRI
jgi:hypothetical protein